MAPYGVCKLENTSKSTWISIFMDIKRKLSHLRDKVQNMKIFSNPILEYHTPCILVGRSPTIAVWAVLKATCLGVCGLNG